IYPMKIVFFSAQPYDQLFFKKYNTEGFELVFLETSLQVNTVSLAAGANAICVFVNDVVNNAVIEQLSKMGVSIIALRCAGFNNVDLEAA
ncbi:2-hydroxyacid dehydrogenase, partial [Acinetobacter baumannii]